MVFADPVHLEPDRFGHLDLFQDASQPITVPDRRARLRIGVGLREGGDSEFHRASIVDRMSSHIPAFRVLAGGASRSRRSSRSADPDSQA